MLADRVRMSYMSGSKMYDDPLGSVGSQDLILGDSMAGYFGTVNGLSTNTQLTNLMTMTSGTLLDPANTDITFHKFIHKGRILLIPNRPIKHSISWDNIQSKDGVKGKVITINGQEYLCRLMTGSRHYYTNNPSIIGGEWKDLFIQFSTHLSLNLSKHTWCQEVPNSGLEVRVAVGYNNLSYFNPYFSHDTDAVLCWRPVLEVL